MRERGSGRGRQTHGTCTYTYTGWTEPVAACNGGDLQTLHDVLSLEACQSACEQYDGCLFIVFGPHNGSPICVLKNMDGQPGAGACTGCDENGYCGNTGSCDVSQTTCSSNLPQGCVCNAGFTSDGAEGCQACAAGTYKAGSGNEACTDCGAGKYSAASGATACVCNAGAGGCELTCAPELPCARGHTGPDGQCSICPPGTFKPSQGSAPCSSCPANSHSGRGSVSASNCTCDAGFTKILTGNCTECGAGTYKIGRGDDTCTDCGAGKYSSATGATAEGTCVRCGGGKYSSVMGATSEATCILCAKGKFSAATVSTCLECGAGKFLATQGNDAEADCVACAAGKYSTNVGASSNSTCIPCSSGKYSTAVGAAGESVCEACPPHHDSPAGSPAYTACKPLDGRALVLMCISGYYGTAGDCTACPDNHYCPGGAQAVPCPTGASSSVGSSLVTNCTCGAGSYLHIEEAESYQNRSFITDLRCDPCELGKYSSVAATTSCIFCPAHSTTWTTSSTSEADCVCTPGYYRQVSGSCGPCPNGTYSAGSTSSCAHCPDDSFSPQASTSQQDCSCNVGYTGPDGGSCTPCVPGTFKDTAGSASPHICSRGTYANASGMSFCFTCTPFSDAPAGSSDITDCKCVLGYAGMDGGPCSSCETGKYSNASGTQTCVLCEGGKYLDHAAGVCVHMMSEIPYLS